MKDRKFDQGSFQANKTRARLLERGGRLNGDSFELGPTASKEGPVAVRRNLGGGGVKEQEVVIASISGGVMIPLDAAFLKWLVQGTEKGRERTGIVYKATEKVVSQTLPETEKPVVAEKLPTEAVTALVLGAAMIAQAGSQARKEGSSGKKRFSRKEKALIAAGGTLVTLGLAIVVLTGCDKEKSDDVAREIAGMATKPPATAMATAEAKATQAEQTPTLVVFAEENFWPGVDELSNRLSKEGVIVINPIAVVSDEPDKKETPYFFTGVLGSEAHSRFVQFVAEVDEEMGGEKIGFVEVFNVDEEGISISTLRKEVSGLPALIEAKANGTVTGVTLLSQIRELNEDEEVEGFGEEGLKGKRVAVMEEMVFEEGKWVKGGMKVMAVEDKWGLNWWINNGGSWEPVGVRKVENPWKEDGRRRGGFGLARMIPPDTPTPKTPEKTATAEVTVTPPDPTKPPEATATLTAEQKVLLAWEEAVNNSEELFSVEGGGVFWRTLVHDTLSDVGFEAVVQDEQRAREFVLNSFYLHAQSYYGYTGDFETFKSEWQSVIPLRKLEIILSERVSRETELSNLPTDYTMSNQSVMNKFGWRIDGDTVRIVVKIDSKFTTPQSFPWDTMSAMIHAIQSMGLEEDIKGNVSMQLGVVKGTRFYQGFYPIFAGGEIDEPPGYFYLLAVRFYNKGYPQG